MAESTQVGAPPSRPATIARRAGSLLYEALLLAAVLFVAGVVALPLVTPRNAGALPLPPLPAQVALFCLLFAVLAGYCVLNWSRGRRTLPMKTWRMRLLMANGGPVSRKTALLRYFAAWLGPAMAIVALALLRPHGLGAHAVWLLGFGFFWVLVDPERQFLHDRLAGTRLVTE